ncbi:MAG TPA: DUF4340 domain-containing protein, partial [Methylomirabilota bacterium]|nr:DUF4340 domain-containing protein [Methylomirabilota bacterium]
AIEGQKISLEAGDGQTWRIVKPGPYRADAELIGDFLDKLQSAKAKAFVADGPKSLQPWGLDRPTTVTLWTGKDKERASKVLLFGRTDKDRKGVYVMRAGDTSVMLAPEDLWTVVPKTAAALRDKVVVAYAADTVNRLEVEHARGKVTVEKAGGEWKITAPEALKADSGAVANLLWKVRDLRASGFLGETAADIPRYLAKPEVTVRLWQEGAKEPMVLLLRSSPESRKGQPQAVAAVQGQGPVVLVDGKAIGDLSKTVTDLRDHSIFPAFETKDVKRLVVTAGGKRMVVERSGETDWKVLEPSKGVAKEHKVVNALLTLKALRWKDMLASRGDEAARFGFDTPEVEVTVLKSDGGELATLQVGNQEGGLTYVRLKSPPTVYSVETKTLGDLRKAQTDIPG